MAETRPVWGIEIGQYALKAIKLQYNSSSEQVTALAFDYVPYPKILSQPDAIPEELIPQALETFVSRNDLQGNLLAISVPGHSALVRFIQLPPVESSKVGEIIKYEARQQIPFALEEVIWDYQPLGSGIEESGYMLDAEVGLFAMKRDQVMNHLRPFDRAKLEVELIQIAPLALYNMLCYDELGIQPGGEGGGGEEHVIVLDMGCDNTTLLVSNGAKIWVRNVPVGGNHFTRALTKEMKLSFAKAEHLKCNATKSPDPRAVFQALRPVFNDYVSEIQRSIGFFSSVNRQAKISKVLGYGNGFKLAGLQKFLQQNLQYDVVRPDTFRQLAGDSVLNTPLFQENLLGFAVPYGLALQTLGLSKIHTSLLPPEIAMARKVRAKKPWAVLTAAALLSGVALSMIGNGITYSAVHTTAWKEAEEEAKTFGDKVDGWKSAYAAEEGQFNGIREEAHSLVEGRRNMFWPEVYKAINETLPRDRGDVQQDSTKIQLRNRVSITSITTQHLGDVGEWYNMLTDEQKDSMSDWDQENPPSGEGYVFTLQGNHYHFDEEDPEQQALAYVIKAFLKSDTGLQKWTITAEDGSPQDVGRLGISHALAYQTSHEEIEYDPRGPQVATRLKEGENRTNVFGPAGLGAAGSRGGRSQAGMGSNAAMQMLGGGGFSGLDPSMLGMASQFGISPGSFNGNGAILGERDPDATYIYETRFIVQFVWKKTPAEDRTDGPVASPATDEDSDTGSDFDSL